jgi:hypothetical protein
LCDFQGNPADRQTALPTSPISSKFRNLTLNSSSLQFAFIFSRFFKFSATIFPNRGSII